MNSITLPELYPEKKRIFETILDYLKKEAIGYIDVPTGYGKTFISKHLILKYLNEGKRILFITSRNKYLLLQTYFKDIDKELPLFPNSICLSSDFEMSRWDDDKIKDYILNNNILIVFASLQTILSKKKIGLRYFFATYFDLVIVDELHNFIKNLGNEFINLIIEKNKGCHIFGMTATPFQGVVNNLKYVEDISQDMEQIFEKTIAKCVLDKQLSPLKYMVVRNHMDIDSVFDLGKNLDGLRGKELYLDWRRLDQIIERTRLAKQIYDEKIGKFSKTLMFCAPVKNIGEGKGTRKKITSFHAKLSAAIFNDEIDKEFDPELSMSNKNDNGEFKKAAFVTSDLKQKDVKEVVAAFKTFDNPPYVLCTVGMLVEGFNFPRLKNLILVRPTLSMRLFEQEIGRVLRIHKEKDVANIYEIVDNVDIDSLYEKFGASIFSSTKSKRILMLNPEHRLEKLLIKDAKDLEAFEQELIKIEDVDKGEPKIIDIKDIKFTDYDKIIHDLTTKWPPLDFRIKLFLKNLQKINLKKSGNFKKDKIILMEMISTFKITSIEDLEDLIEAFPVIDHMVHYSYNDHDLTQRVLEDKEDFLNETKAFLKLKALTELEKLPKLLKNSKEDYIKLLGFNNPSESLTQLQEYCLLEGKGVNLPKFMEHLQISIGVLTGKLERKLIEQGEKISKSSRVFNKQEAKSDILWAETIYHDKLDLLYDKYKDYYSQKEIKIGF